MRKLVLFIFAAIFAANIVACSGPCFFDPPPGVELSLVAVDGDNNDLLDTTKSGHIDLRRVKMRRNDHIFFDGSTRHPDYYNLIPVKCDQINQTCQSFKFFIEASDKAELVGGCVVDWGNGVVDILQVKEFDGGRRQLFHNKKLVWDNKDDVSVDRTTYIRRFERSE